MPHDCKVQGAFMVYKDLFAQYSCALRLAPRDVCGRYNTQSPIGGAGLVWARTATSRARSFTARALIGPLRRIHTATVHPPSVRIRSIRVYSCALCDVDTALPAGFDVTRM